MIIKYHKFKSNWSNETYISNKINNYEHTLIIKQTNKKYKGIAEDSLFSNSTLYQKEIDDNQIQSPIFVSYFYINLLSL